MSWVSPSLIFKKSANPDLVDSEKQVINISTNPYLEKSENIVFKELYKSIFGDIRKPSVQ